MRLALAMTEPGGTPAGRSAPMRRCIATREVLPRRALLRFVVAPDGRLVPDIAGRLDGRGLWLQPVRAIVEQAVHKNLFAKAARAPVDVPADLADRVERLLAGRCLDLLGLARRAGHAVTGFERVQEWLTTGRAGLLLAARDGAPDGRRKLRARARDIPLVELFDAAELSQALGRETVVHIAVASGRLADAIVAEAGRLSGLRS